MHAGSSPLTRGARKIKGDRDDPSRLIPAHAGSTRNRTPRKTMRTAHPRSRGEHLNPSETARPSLGSSPLTRGALWYRRFIQGEWGLIPAHAGSTPHS